MFADWGSSGRLSRAFAVRLLYLSLFLSEFLALIRAVAVFAGRGGFIIINAHTLRAGGSV